MSANAQNVLLHDLNDFEKMLPLIRKTIIEGNSNETDDDAMETWRSDLYDLGCGILRRNGDEGTQVIINLGGQENTDLMVMFAIRFKDVEIEEYDEDDDV